jgi:PAS domain S-box-containing protein
LIEIKLRSSRYLTFSVVLAIVYFAAAEFGLSLASAHINVSPVWPPTGVAIAALLILGRSFWPAILVGAFGANLLTPIPLLTAAGIAAGNTLEALTAWYLLSRTGWTERQLESTRGVLRFILLAVILSPMVSATIGNLSLCLGGAAPWSNFPQLWVTWWLGDGFGALVIAPFILSWTSRSKAPPRSRVISEGSLILVLLFLTAMIVFGGWLPGPAKDYPIEHLCLPFLVWAALRLDQRLLFTAILLLSGIAVWGTSLGHGPFVQSSPNASLLLLQLFIGVSTLLALLLYAVMVHGKEADAAKASLNAELQLHRQRIADIVAHVPGVVWEAWGEPDAANQRIDFVSSHVEKMLGYSEQEWLSTPNFWLSIVHPDDRERAAREARSKFTSGDGGVSRFRWMARNGEEVWVEARSVVVKDEDGRPVGMRGVTTDVTSAIRVEEERSELLNRERAARALAEDASRLKDEFLANTSHELRTPLTAIVGWIRLLRSGQLDQKTSGHAFEVIEQNAWSQTRIVEDMLDVSRIITGKLNLTFLPFDLLPVITAAIDAVHPAAQAKGIRILTHFESGNLIVNGDPDRLQQVAWNLLANAVKFTPDGGQVDVSVNKEDSYVKVLIADSGIGIEPAFLPHVFERFTQADRSTTRKYGGLGLGLAIVRHLVELHGGRVEAHNRAEQTGAVFTVSLPLSSISLPDEEVKRATLTS